MVSGNSGDRLALQLLAARGPGPVLSRIDILYLFADIGGDQPPRRVAWIQPGVEPIGADSGLRHAEDRLGAVHHAWHTKVWPGA